MLSKSRILFVSVCFSSQIKETRQRRSNAPEDVRCTLYHCIMCGQVLQILNPRVKKINYTQHKQALDPCVMIQNDIESRDIALFSLHSIERPGDPKYDTSYVCLQMISIYCFLNIFGHRPSAISSMHVSETIIQTDAYHLLVLEPTRRRKTRPLRICYQVPQSFGS